jgi:O-antigen/teichoic acid export membrane protein
MAVSSSNLLSRGIGLASSLGAAAVLAPSELGGFAFLLMTASLLGALGTLGFGPLLTNAIAEADDARAARAIGTSGFEACLVLLALCAGVYMAALLPDFGFLSLPENTSAAIVTVALWGLCTGVNPILSAIMAGHREFGLITKLNLFRACTLAIGTYTGAAVGGSAVWAAAGACIGEGTSAFLAWGLSRRAGWIRTPALPGWKYDRRGMASTAVGAGLAALVIQAAMWVGQLMLLRTPDGSAHNGGFLLATRLALIVTLVPNALAMTSLPFLSDHRQSLASRQRQLGQVFLYGVAGAVPVALLLAVGGWYLTSLIGDEYLEFRPAILVMAFAGIAIAANNILGTFAVATHRLPSWILSDLLLAAVLVVGATLLVPHLKSTGLAWAYLAAYAASALVLLPSLLDPRLASRKSNEVSQA